MSKFVSVLLAAAGMFPSAGLLDGAAELVLSTTIAAVGAALVLRVPNAPSAAAGRPGRSAGRELRKSTALFGERRLSSGKRWR